MMRRVGNLSYDPRIVIGQGTFGVVFRGHYDVVNNTSISGMPAVLAVKRIDSNYVEEESFLREVNLMKVAEDHPNILRYICTERNDDFLFVATELCSGTLEDYIKETYEGPKFKSEKEILIQATRGLAHLHSLKIVHRDIKPTNILIFISKVNCEPQPQIKLADFGLSKRLKISKKDFTNTNMKNPSGTNGWMAPEVYEVERFDFKVDIWSLGLVFGYTLSGGTHPFGENEIIRTAQIVQKKPMGFSKENLKKPYSMDSVGFKLIKSMLKMESTKRPSIKDVEGSSFFQVVQPNMCTQMKGEKKSTKKIKVDEISEQAIVLGRPGRKGTIVFKGRYDGREVAVKRIQMQNAQIEANREKEALLMCQHPNVLQLFKVEEDENFMRLALKLCAGNLSDFCLGRYTGPFPADIEAMKQMIVGLAYLHKKKYVHRDVKPKSILISISGTLKISNFKFCEPIGSSDYDSLPNARIGTEGWVAPELLRNLLAVEESALAASSTSLTTITSRYSNNSSSDPSKFKDTTAIDVFPLGCVFYYLLTRGSHPFGSGTYRNINILEGKPDLSRLGRNHIAKGLIREMIHPSPKHRPQLQEILTRPMFNVTTPRETPAELIRDANKFEKLLESFRLRFTPKPRSSKTTGSPKSRVLPGLEETRDYSLKQINNNKALHPSNTWTASTYVGFQNGLQTVGVLGDDASVPDSTSDTTISQGHQRALKATMAPPLKTLSSSQVFSESDAWRRSVSVQKAARRLGFMSENFDESDETLLNAAYRTCSATHLSSQSSLTSSDDSFYGSFLGGSFMGSNPNF